MMRSARVHIAGRLSYREALVEFYERSPAATLDDARRATGAPIATVRHVRSQLLAAGRLQPYRPRQPDPYAAV
jgi:hypothetical protein